MGHHLPVLIIGAGPTGLMMACELARHGIEFRIIDKNAEATKGTNATWMQTRTLEILEAMGIVDRFLKVGNRCKGVNFYVKGKQIVNIPLNISESIYPFILMLPQRDTERLLKERLDEFHVQIERSVELIDIKQTNDSVVSTVRLANGNTETITSHWVVACDGANSVIRNKCQISFPGKDLPEQFMVADAHMGSFLPKNEIHVFFDKGTIFPDKSTLFAAFPWGTKEYRLCANLYLERPRQTFTEQEVREVVAERTYGNYVVEKVSWISPFWMHTKIVDQMRHGSIFLAGDAAHTHAPVGGQGMNTGLQDAYNLAWKLALVVKGQANQSLLDSYQSERRPDAGKIVNETAFFIDMMLFDKSFVSKLKSFSQTVVHDALFAKKINRQLTQLDTHYQNSPVIDYHEIVNEKMPQQGEFAPFVLMNQSKKAYDFLNNEKHNILLFAGDNSTPETFEKMTELQKLLNANFSGLVNVVIIANEALRDVENMVIDVDGAIHKRYGVKTPFVYIIRPDHFIAYCSDKFDFDPVKNFLKKYLLCV